MKRFLAFVIFFVYLISANACFALSELYYLENVNQNTISNEIETLLTEKDYKIQKSNPFYALSSQNSGNNVIIILQPAGKNLYYYFETNNSQETSFNKAFLKTLDKQNISYNEYYDENYMKSFASSARNLVTGAQKTYSFEDTSSAVHFQQAKEETQTSSNVLKGYVASVGKGTSLDAYLQRAINTATARTGDNVTAVLKSDWVTRDRRVIAPQGSLIYGTITKAEPAKIGMRNGKVSIDFNKLVTPDSKTYELSTQAIDFDVTNDGGFKTSVSNIAVSAALGALVGLAIGAIAGGGRCGRGAAIGAGVSGGLALISTVAQKGVDAEIPSFTDMDIKVQQDINVIFNN